jgi:hypothetical protein
MPPKHQAPPPPPPRTNENGLTFERWAYAAGTSPEAASHLRPAWERGEDPAEYRLGRLP